MANRFYAKGKRRVNDADVHWSLADIKAVLVSSAYTPDTNVDEFYAAVKPHILGAPVKVLGRVSEDGGVADATDLTLPIKNGETAAYVVIFKDTGSPDTSPLLLLFDTAPGLPVTAVSDGNVVVQWDNSGNKVYRL